MKPVEGMITGTVRGGGWVLPALWCRNTVFAGTCRTAAVLRKAIKGAPVLKMDCKELMGLRGGNKQDSQYSDGFWYQECSAARELVPRV
jgi:hypothetical protein